MSDTIMLGVAGAVSGSLTLLVLFTFMLVVATVVRRHRPDVAPILLAALSLEFLFTFAGFAAHLLMPRFLAGGNMAAYAQAQAMSTITVSLGYAASRGLLIWGVARLASPPGS